MSIRPDCTAANRPLNGMFSIATVLPSRLATSFDQVDLEADELAGRVLELPRHVADIGADGEVGGLGGGARQGTGGGRHNGGKGGLQECPAHVVSSRSLFMGLIFVTVAFPVADLPVVIDSQLV